MKPLSRELQAEPRPGSEDTCVIRRVCIPIILAVAVGLGYFALIAPESPNTVLLDIAFLASVFSFLVLLVSVLGDQLKHSSD